MENSIKSLLSNFEILISDKPQNKDKISNALKQLEQEILNLEEDDQNLFGYFKYVLAQICLNHLSLSAQQEKKYKNHTDIFVKEYESFLQPPYKQNSQYCQEQFQEELKMSEDQLNFLKNQKKKVFLIIGKTGVGKSSLIQKITGDKKAEASNSKDSHTKECRIFVKNDRKFIDTPGINDTLNHRYEILLKIAKFLKENGLILDDIFIISVQNKQLDQFKQIQEFCYTYFLYELFIDQINAGQVEKLMNEYFQTSCLLNWFECGIHLFQDALSQNRQKIFSQKDLASNYLQYCNCFHIRVITYFDKTHKEDLKVFDKHFLNNLKEQIWSDKPQENIFFEYNEYIKTQEAQLFHKIDKIIQLDIKNKIWDQGKQVQNILLIGESQVGKSSVIEQLTELKGLRGSGKSSETSMCQIYSFEFENILYRIIDTPGYEGTEQNQTPFHSLKIITDYLKRNQINEFKIAYMCDPQRDIRDTSSNVLNQLFIFIKYMFDQDISFVDTDYLNDLFGMCTQKQNDFLKQKVVQIFRYQIDSNDNEAQEIDQKILQENLKTIKFSSNYFTKNRKFIELGSNNNLKQIKTMFEVINEIDYVTIEDKILFQLKQTYQSVVITDTQTYLQAYYEIYSKYIELYLLQKQINQLKESKEQEQKNPQQEIKTLNDKKLQIKRELGKKLFRVVGLVQKTNQIQQDKFSYSLGMNQEMRNKIENDISRHFIFINYDPILYESGPTTPQNVFLSRKQLYYSALTHQLKRFIKNRRPDKRLEDLAELKVVQEITFQKYQLQKFIESNYDKDPKSNGEIFQVLSQGFNTIFGTCIQIYRYATYFSELAEAGKILAKNANIIGVYANAILSVVSIGIDIYSYKKGHICGKQFSISTSFNFVSGLTSISAFFVPGVGWIVGGVAGCISLVGFGISSYFFTSSSTFDQTISKFVKIIMDDTLPNQSLLYFQKSQLLKQHFNFKNYSQLKNSNGYDMFRELEIENYQNQKQKSILLQLHGFQSESNLLNQISKYIVINQILNQFKVEFQQSINEDNLQFLQRITQEFQENQQLIRVFFNRFNETYLKNITKSYDKVVKVIKKRLEEYQKKKESNHTSFSMKLETKEQLKISNYLNEMKQFKQQIKNLRQSYDDQVEQGNGYFRKADRFPILFNSYCNLMQLKINIKYNQPIISELQKDPKSQKFIVKESTNKTDTFKNLDDEQLINQIDLLSMSDKYITNRYLQKIQGEKEPNLTSLSESEILDCQLEYSIDLHDLAENSIDCSHFIESIKSLTKYSFNSEICERFKYFYLSIKFLKKYFE